MKYRAYFAVSAVVLALDQLTKILAHAFLRGRGDVEIIPGLFDLSYSRNPGGLFGSFSQWNTVGRTLLLTVLPIVAIVLIGRALAVTDDLDRKTRFGLALILGGATGNLIDRLIRGEVVDFLDVYASGARMSEWLTSTFGTAHWPTFNVADSSIVTGAGLLLLAIVRPQTRESATSDARRAAGQELPR